MIMKKLLIIAAASSFLFISCKKDAPTEPGTQPITQSTPVKEADVTLDPLSTQQYVITNTETEWGVVEYRLEYTDVSGVVHIVPLEMGQSITLCLSSTKSFNANFAYTIRAIGDC